MFSVVYKQTGSRQDKTVLSEHPTTFRKQIRILPIEYYLEKNRIRILVIELFLLKTVKSVNQV